MRAKWVQVDPDTLSVTPVCEGEVVVLGGDDGQAWVGSFAEQDSAQLFIDMLRHARRAVWALLPVSRTRTRRKPH